MTGEPWEQAAEAIRSGDSDRLVGLLDAMPDLVAVRGPAGETLLHLAAEHDALGCASVLLARDADENALAGWGQTPFEWAANLGSDAVARLLLDRGAGPRSLWTAAALGQLDEVRGALESNDPGRPLRPGFDLRGWPDDTAFRLGDAVSDALYIACRRGRLSVARELMAHGANPNVRGYFGAPALHWAAIGGHADVVEFLLRAGADPTLRDPRWDADAAGWAREGGHHDLAQRIASTRELP